MSHPSAEKHLGQYRILRTLGSGGMGTVYLGEHLLLGRRAAIKTLLPSLSSHREIVDRFFNEARAISAISDPGVVQIFDFGYHVDGTAYIVMEYLEGESLATRLGRLGTLRLADALRLARQLASSLAAAHERGVIHRDLKPANVFVIRDPEVPGGERAKILDFGICKLGAPDDAGATQTGTMLGTPVYMSPEQCRGAGRIDQRSDIYSLGCVLFHMICGRPPFDCEAAGDYIASHIKEPAPVPSTLAPAIPASVDEVIAHCLAKDPEQRLRSMAEVQRVLEQVLARVSDVGASDDATIRTTTPLGEGFQSSYDVNAAARPTDTSAAAREWFVDSGLPVSYSAELSIAKPRATWGRGLAYLCALGLGVASGLAGASYAFEEPAVHEVVAPTAPTMTSPEDFEPSVTMTAFETAPPDLVEVEAPAVAAPVAAPKRAARPARSHAVTKPARPRPIARTPAPKPAPEDLYDSR